MNSWAGVSSQRNDTYLRQSCNLAKIMELVFKPIIREQAVEYSNWKYEAPYDLYNISDTDRQVEIDGMLKVPNTTFAIVSGGELIGVRSFGEDGKVRGGSYDEQYQDTGGALRPNLTGKGLGEEVMRAGLAFGREELGFTQFRVTVAAFNQRALTVCKRVEFKEKQRFLRESDQREFLILTLEAV